MDLNVTVQTASELFEDSDMVFPILMGRENLKILTSPGSESSGVSSLDADEAKKLVNDQLPSTSSPTLVSEPTSTVQTESESSDGSSDGSTDGSSDGSSEADDDNKLTEQSPISDCVESADEHDQQSVASDNEDKGDESEAKVTCIDDNDHGSTQQQPELVTPVTVQANQDKDKANIIDLDEIRYKNLKLIYEGRDILDFSSNVATRSWEVQYAHLPEKNYLMYINNRSQYNRLASGYEPNQELYSLNRCSDCTFQFPVVADMPDEIDPTQHVMEKRGLTGLLTHTIQSKESKEPKANHHSPSLFSAQTMACSTHTPTAGHSVNLNNVFMLNNSNAVSAAAATSNGQTYNAYQNQNQNRNQFHNAAAIAAAAAAAAAANNTNNHTCYKQNNNASIAGANAFYGNNVVLNALVNQIGNNMNKSSNNVFNKNFMNALSVNSNVNTNVNANVNVNANNNAKLLNQSNNAALAYLMNQNQQQLYGMCRQNLNKSGINFNANSHKSMPTYSHF